MLLPNKLARFWHPHHCLSGVLVGLAGSCWIILSYVGTFLGNPTWKPPYGLPYSSSRISLILSTRSLNKLATFRCAQVLRSVLPTQALQMIPYFLRQWHLKNTKATWFQGKYNDPTFLNMTLPNKLPSFRLPQSSCSPCLAGIPFITRQIQWYFLVFHDLQYPITFLGKHTWELPYRSQRGWSLFSFTLSTWSPKKLPTFQCAHVIQSALHTSPSWNSPICS